MESIVKAKKTTKAEKIELLLLRLEATKRDLLEVKGKLEDEQNQF